MASVTLIKRSVPVCPGCLVMKTMLEGEGIEHDVIDITENPEAIESWNLSAVPVTIVINGNGVKRFEGVTSADEIREAMGE